MTRKDFKQFASLFHITIEQHRLDNDHDCNAIDCDVFYYIGQLVYGSMNIFHNANDRFNREKFVSAVGNWYDEYKTNPLNDHMDALTALELNSLGIKTA